MPSIAFSEFLSPSALKERAFVAPVGPIPHPVLKEVDGRKFHAQGTPYHLPADDLEFTRLDQQHRKNTLALGGLYTCPELVNDALAPEQGKKKRILDLGCGSGVWTVEMALEFPEAQVLGLDLVPNTLKKVPSNCEFRIHDLNHGLYHYYDMFDVVHMRSVAGGLRSFTDSVQEAVKCLRPGGVFLLVEGDFEFYRDDMTHYQEPRGRKFPNGSWASKHAYDIQDAQVKSGSDILGAIASVDGGLWGYPGFDEDTMGAMSIFTPFGPWPECNDPEEQARITRIGQLQKEVWMNFTNGSRIVLVRTGMPGEVIDDLVDMSLADVHNPHTHRAWMRFRYCWARKLLADGTPAPGAPLDKTGYAPLPPYEFIPPPTLRLPSPAGATTHREPTPDRYPLKHYYYTKEATRAWGAWRQKERRRVGARALPSSIPWGDIVS